MVLVALLLIGCSQTQPRRPVSRKSHSTISKSIALNKQRVAEEDAYIKNVIDSLPMDFQRDGNGFFFHFIQKDSVPGPKPEFDDEVTFAYNVVGLDGQTIYTRKELSPITRNLETEYGIFKGMREALKLMQVGDRAVFVFPSYTAYGYYGDEKRIGTNVPFISEVELINIDKNEN